MYVILERNPDGTSETVAIRQTDGNVETYLEDNIGEFYIYDENGADCTNQFRDDVIGANEDGGDEPA